MGAGGPATMRKLLVQKLWALRQLGLARGWLGESRPEEAYEFDGLAVIGAICSLANPRAHWFKKEAAGMVLDHYVPGWREAAHPSLLGNACSRGDEAVAAWRLSVLARDNYECTQCGSMENLHAHHIVRWVDAPSMRLVLENGRTLCESCHRSVHASMC